jgi:hypothetical protein
MYAECSFSSNTPPYATIGAGSYILGLTLHLNVIRSERNERILSNISGRLFWGASGAYISEFRPTEAFNIRSNPTDAIPFQLQLQSAFTRQNLEKIEALRNGGNIEFKLRLFADLIGFDDSTNDRIFFARTQDEVQIRIQQSEWIKLLNVWKFGSHLLFEISLDDSVPEKLQRAYSCLTVAQTMFFQGSWEQCVSECRKSLEALHLYIGNNTSLKELLSQKKFNSLPERCLVLLLAAKDICHLASHSDDTAASTVWKKKDAELLLHQVAICLKTFSDKN